MVRARNRRPDIVSNIDELLSMLPFNSLNSLMKTISIGSILSESYRNTVLGRLLYPTYTKVVKVLTIYKVLSGISLHAL